MSNPSFQTRRGGNGDETVQEGIALDPAQLRLPPGMNFACQSSGHCCEDFWEIPLDDESLARLKLLPLGSLSPKFIDPAHYTEKGPRPESGLGLRRVSGRCVFLDTNRTCLIHRNFGPAAKPQICRDFPFRYVCTPRGVFVGLSMACPSVRANRGRPVAEMRDELAENFPRSQHVVIVPEPVELSSGLPIGFDAYEQIESCLNFILALESLSFDDRLIAGYVFLQLLERALHEMGGPPDAAMENAGRIAQALQNDNYRRIIAIARKARGSDRLHRALLGLLITYRSAFDQRLRGRAGRSAYLIYQYVRHMGGLGSVAMPPLQDRLSLSRLRAVRADWSNPYFAHLLGRFCAQSLFRKDAIVATPLLKGYGFMLVFVAAIRWYALAYAASRGAREVEREDINEALSAVEKYYCFHTAFMRLFDQYPILTGLVERVMAKPVFAPSMLRPKGP